MAIEKKDPTFFERFFVPLFSIFGVSSLLACITIGLVMPQHERLGIMLFCCLIIVMVVLLALLHHRVLGGYQCLQCQTKLPRHKDKTRPRDCFFYCKDCDVIWKVGLQDGDGSE